MERVVTINLNGNPYQLEEPAYDALRAYLGRAQAALAENPDKTEIVRDLEQAIADKCAAYLSPAKTVVTAGEMARILEEMGPVEGEREENAPRAEAGPHDGARKRLYRIKDGAWIAGICTGLAAYLNVEVTIVRLIAIVLGFLTSGWILLVYLIAMFMIPSAHTSEEWAAAHGLPFNTQEVIERAKREYARVAEDVQRDWRSSFRAQRRAFREQMHGWRWRNWDYGAGPAAPPSKPVGYVTRVFAGLGAFVFSIVTAALLIAFLLAFFGFVSSGAVFGWTPPSDVPGWLVLVVIAIAYAAISAPFSALRRASYATVSGYHHGGHGADGIIVLALVVASAWFAWNYIPEGRVLLEQALDVLRSFADYARAALN
jgi:phage shock protein PspC (stress-responsive transcriptional regulator)